MWSERIRIAAVGCATVAAIRLCGCFLPAARVDAKAVRAAQDEVYEAVVRNMVSPADVRSGVSELVFSDRVSIPPIVSADVRSCEEQAQVDLHISPPAYNTLVDKLYRLFTRGYDDYFVRADTIQDFKKAYCKPGPLPQSFHTDLPRHFIAHEAKIYMADLVPINKNGWKPFKQLFPRATGIISFSHVGFDWTLDQAMVFTAVVCGDLCGGGTVYVLRKIHGRWRVVSSGLIWES